MTEAITAQSLLGGLGLDEGKHNRIPSDAAISEAAERIGKRGVKVVIAADRKDALAKVADLIPEGAEVMTGSSTTLIEIGFTDALAGGRKGWKSLWKGITGENDMGKRHELRRKAVIAEYFVSGVNAISKSGELVACDASGSRVGAMPFAAKNLVLVAGANKITPSLEDAMRRVREFAYPLEDARAKKVYGIPSSMNKFVIIAGDAPGRTTLVLVKEKLGY